MEGTNPPLRSVAAPSYLPGNGNAGIHGGGTYTGNSLEPQIGDWENIFGPAGRDVKVDQQRQKRHQRWHLPDVLKGPNAFLTDRIDGLITDTTNSPFTTIILPYKYIENPDAKIKWNAYSFDEGLASRVPYESAARVLTQTKRSYAAYAVRNGLAIEMEHNFMMSAKGMENFQNQVKQLVGSIQQSNDLDVHIALVQAPSYAKEYMEKYSGSDKTPYQVCREYVDLFGIMQKNPNALDILIEEAKIQLRLWGSPEPSFLMCNSKLTFQLQMVPDRTNYITNGIDGVKRLRQGPDIGQYRGLSIVNSRAYSMESGAPPRDVLRRRVRVAEYYRIPPQPDRDWEVELYDESRDTWFKLSPADLDRYADLSGQGGDGNFNNYARNVDNNQVTWEQFIAGNPYVDGGPFLLKMNDDPPETQSRVLMPHLLQPTNNGLDWGARVRQVQTMHNGAFNLAHTRDDHHAIVQEIVRGMGNFVPRPNYTNLVNEPFPGAETIHIPFWLFMNAAFMPTVCNLLWVQISTPDRDMIRNRVIPFVYGQNANGVQQDYDAIDENSRLNIYHSLMFLGLPMRLHPDDAVRTYLEKKFSERGVSIHTLRATLTQFVRRCLDDSAEPIPTNRIQLGKRLDNAFRTVRFAQPDGARSLYDRWPSSPAGLRPIAVAAGVAENIGSLDDYRIEEYYNRHADEYPWNAMDEIANGHENSVHETTTLDSFLYAAMLRMMTNPEDHRQRPDFWPVFTSQNSTANVEYVIVRPVIEHNMLGVIMGRGGGDELGNTLWGQTELSCYDDSFHGVWGMSYKYHERAIVHNPKNMIRLWDIAYDGYNGGKDDRAVNWAEESPGSDRPFNAAVGDMSVPYTGPSLMVMKFTVNTASRDYTRNWPSPIVFHDKLESEPPRMGIDPDSMYTIADKEWRVFNRPDYREQYRAYLHRMPDFTYYHQTRKLPGYASVDLETTQNALAFQGSMRILRHRNGCRGEEVMGSGHHGPDYVGVSGIRAGKGMRPVTGAPTAMRLI